MRKFSLLLIIMLIFSHITVFSSVKFYDGEASVTVNPSDTFSVESVGGFGGKIAADKVYKINGKGTNYGANYVEPGLRAFNINGTIEYSLLFEDEASVHTIAVNYYNESKANGGGKNNIFKFSPSYDYIKANAGSANIGEYKFECGKWYRIAINYTHSSESSGSDFEVYVNGNKIGSWKYNALCGIRRFALGCTERGDGTNSVIYIDNIATYNGSDEEFNPKSCTPSELVSTDTSISLKDGVYVLDSEYTVQKFKESVVTSNVDDTIRIYNSDMTSEIPDGELIDNAVVVIAAKCGRDYESAYAYYSVGTAQGVLPPLRSSVYELGETISIMPYTTLETFKENVILKESCTLVVSYGEKVYADADIIAEGSTITVSDSVSGEVLQTHNISVSAKTISDNFDLQSEKMYTGGVSLDGKYSFAGPVLTEGYAPEEYAYIEALDYPGKGKVIHSYSNGSHSAESGRVHMNLISKVTPKKATIGSRFAFHVSVMLPNSSDTYATLASYKTKDGETKTLQVALQMKDGSVSFFGGTVGSYKTGEWTDILLLCDSTDGSVTSYINNVLVAETKITSFKEFDSFTNIRPVHHIYQSGKVVESYLSCFEVFGIGSVCTKVAADNNTMLLSDGYTVSGQEINGFISMTASDIMEASHIADGATIKIYTASGSILPSDAKVESEMYAVVISASGVAEAVYTFGAEHCRVDGLRILVNGGANFEKFVSGTITAQVDAENYCNTAYPLTIAIAHYSGNKLLALDFNSFELSKGSHKPEAGIEISDTADTFIKAFVFGSDKCMSPLEANLYMEAFSADSIEDVRILYPGYVEKAVTFSYDDLVSNDERLIGIFDENGIKGTFNLMTNRITESNTSIVLNRYSGHEIASHSWSHPRMYITKDTVIDGVTYKPLSYDEVVADIQKAQDDIEALTGEVPIGFAWPYARASSRKDYSEILDYMQSVGIRYTRSVTDSFSFDLPTDWMEWDPTCHHDDAAEYTEKFINLENDGTLKLLYIWGHSYEFSTSKVMDWDGITEVCRALGADNSIWKATNGELYNYIEATKLVEVDYDNGTITNNSSHDVYLAVNSVNISVPANSQFVIKP